MAASFNKNFAFCQDIGRGVHNLNSDTLKDALTNTAPTTASALLSDITQITAANGYSSGGTAIGSTAYSQTTGTGTLSAGKPAALIATRHLSCLPGKFSVRGYSASFTYNPFSRDVRQFNIYLSSRHITLGIGSRDANLDLSKRTAILIVGDREQKFTQ